MISAMAALNKLESGTMKMKSDAPKLPQNNAVLQDEVQGIIVGGTGINTKNDTDYLMHCLIERREGDNQTLFRLEGDYVHCRLNGYAIIPMEKYQSLIAPNRMTRLISWLRLATLFHKTATKNVKIEGRL